jgi:uncharacterized protein (DUF305 family)
MSKSVWALVLTGVVLAGLLAGGTVLLSADPAPSAAPMKPMGAGAMACDPNAMQQMSGQLAAAAAAVEAAQKALATSDAKTAAAELDKAKKALADAQQACKTCCAQMGMATTQPVATVKCVNSKCPILGAAINPDKVPSVLTRMYKDQTVGFCCGGCPETWDKLTDAEKDAKLAKAK